MRKTTILFSAGMLLTAGCSSNEQLDHLSDQLEEVQSEFTALQNTRATRAELEEIRTELVSVRNLAAQKADLTDLPTNSPISRIAVVDSGALSRITSQWTQRRIQEEEAKEKLTEEQQEALAHYQEVQGNLHRFRGELMRRRAMFRGGPEALPAPMMFDPQSDPEYVQLAEKVDKARAPVADILARRAQRHQNLQYPIRDLVGEYAKERFDIVLDRHVLDMSHQLLFLRDTEIVDITQGVIDLFERKEISGTLDSRKPAILRD